MTPNTSSAKVDTNPSVKSTGGNQIDQLRHVVSTNVTSDPKYVRHASTNGRRFIKLDNDVKYGNYLHYREKVNDLATNNFDRKMTYGAEPKGTKAAWVNDTNIERRTISSD